MNTGVGSLSLLQGIFLTQESTRGLLHCRQILYLVSYQEAHLATYLSIYLPLCCSARCLNPRAGREKAFKTMQFTKREVYY